MAIVSEDNSAAMVNVGWRIWRAFIREIGRVKEYPRLDALRRVCREMRFAYQANSDTTCWISALHVAYEEGAPQVNSTLANRVGNYNPDIVLVTSHPSNAMYAFSPDCYRYRRNHTAFQVTTLELNGDFAHTTAFRDKLYQENIRTLLSAEDDYFARNYLTRYPTSWVTPDFKTTDFLYIKEASDIHELPF